MKSIIVTPQVNTEINVIEDTQFVLYLPYFSESQKYGLTLLFEKQGVSAEIICFYKLGKNQILNLSTITNHISPNTSCMTRIKGVLESNSQANYVGKILIQKSAQQTNSFLEHNTLVTGNDTKNNSQPILEIEANDVKASHGATTGRIDETQIYYLTSRGLTKKEAKELIVKGFLDDLLNRVSEEEVKDSVCKLLSVRSENE